MLHSASLAAPVLAGGMDYAAVGQAVSRFAKRLARQHQLRRSLTDIETQLSNVDSAEKAL